MLGYIKDSCEIYHHPSCVREKCSCCRGGGWVGEEGNLLRIEITLKEGKK